MSPKEHKNISPRIKVIQKIYGSLMNPDEKIIYPKNQYKKYPITDHVHFYGFYLGNYPDLKKNEIDFICKIINDV